MKGELTVITGSMLGGKSLELIERVKFLKYSEIPYAAFSPIRDKITSRGLVESVSAMHIPWQFPYMISYHAGIEKVKYVVIDEIHFYEESIVTVIKGMLDAGINVIVAGLDQTFAGKPFGSVGNLMALAEQAIKKHSVCMACKKRKATKTQRLKNGKPVPFTDPLFIVDGDHAEYTYECRCADCHEEGEPEWKTVFQGHRQLLEEQFAKMTAIDESKLAPAPPEPKMPEPRYIREGFGLQEVKK